MNGKLNVAAIQMACRESTQANLNYACERIEEAAEMGSDVVCLQELFACPYPCQTEDHRNFDFAESIPGETTNALSQVAKQKSIVIIAPLFERRAPGIYHNSAVVIDCDGQIRGKYRKMHIPDDPNYYEKFYFTPGDLGFQAIPTSRGRFGVCICWDQWFPEAARITSLKGAQVLFFPTAIGWLHGEKEEFGQSQWNAWETMMRSHAIANGVYVVAPNRVGIEGEIEFWGASFICDPNGNIMQRASHQHEELISAEIDLSTIDVVRTHWPFLRDRRIDAYAELGKRYVDEQ